MIDEIQKATIEAIVNIFETGRVRGNYGAVTLIPGDSGHLTYGRSQTTLGSGNLYLLIKDYCENEGSVSAQLSGYLPRLKEIDLTLDSDVQFKTLLRQAGADSTMEHVQDAFFDRVYWTPARNLAQNYGLQCALGFGIVYDSYLHGSLKAMVDKTVATRGTLAELGERPWLEAYIATRRNWLETHSNPALHPTAYRMVAFQSLIAQGKWDLSLPISVRGQSITIDALNLALPRVSAEETVERILSLHTPQMSGTDVGAVQRALSGAGFNTEENGFFDEHTEAAVIAFQKSRHLKADGIVGPATRAALGMEKGAA